MNKWKFNIKVLIAIFFLFIINCSTANAINIKELEACSNKYSQQGMAYYKAGDYNMALEYWTKVLQINLKIYGKKDSRTSMTYFMLGTAYGANGDYDKALDYLSKDLKINLQRLGEENTDIASTYSNMANIYLQKGDYNNSLIYYIKAIRIFKKIKGENSFEVARAYGCIGAVYDDKREYNIALEHYYKALTIFQHISNDNTYDVATVYSNMSNIYYKKMNYEKAISCDNNALNILTPLGVNSSQIENVTNHLALSKAKFELYDSNPIEIIQNQNTLLSCLRSTLDTKTKEQAFYKYRGTYFKILKKLDTKFASTEDFSDQDIIQVNNDLTGLGIKAKKSEGIIYFVEDNDFNIQKFVPYLGKDWNDFYTIRKSENNELFDDGSLVITKEELRRRLIAWEEFLNTYPNFPENNEIKAKLNCYLSAYLRSQYDFSADNQKISAESIESFNNFLEQNQNSKFYPIVKRWNNLLEKNNFKDTNKVEKFKYKNLYKIKKYNEDIFDGFSP